MKKIMILFIFLTLVAGPVRAQDMPMKDIMIIEGAKSLIYGFYERLRSDKEEKTPWRIMELFGESLIRAVPSAALKGMAVPIAQKSHQMPLGLLLYRKGEMLPHQSFKDIFTDWRIRYACFEIGTKSSVKINPRYFVDMTSVIGYGYLTNQKMKMNMTESFYAGKPIFGKNFRRWYAVSPHAAVIGW